MAASTRASRRRRVTLEPLRSRCYPCWAVLAVDTAPAVAARADRLRYRPERWKSRWTWSAKGRREANLYRTEKKKNPATTVEIGRANLRVRRFRAGRRLASSREDRMIDAPAGLRKLRSVRQVRCCFFSFRVLLAFARGGYYRASRFHDNRSSPTLTAHRQVIFFYVKR